MRRQRRPQPPVDPTKENRPMAHRLRILALPLATALLFALLPLGSASAASPWWQLVSGARPTNLWQPKDASEVQEVKTEKFFGLIFAAEVEVAGQVLGCLGTGDLSGFGGQSADEICEGATGSAASETAAEFEAMLEGPYGAGQVQVSGGPVGALPFEIDSPWGPPVKVTPIPTEFFGQIFPMGTASSEVLSQGSGRLFFTATNLGDAPLDATGVAAEVTDELPEGVIATGAEARAGAAGSAGPVACTVEAADQVVCKFEATLPSYEAIEVEIPVVLTGNPPAAGAPGQIGVSGGNAKAASASQPIEVSSAPTRFGIERLSAAAEEEGGEPARKAGGHPFQLSTTIQLNSGEQVGQVVQQPALPRNLRVRLPAGLIGNARSLPQCDMTTFTTLVELFNACPPESAVGVASVTIVYQGNLFREAVPIVNLPPTQGEPARFGFMPVGTPVVIDTAVDPEDEYRIIAKVDNVTQLAGFLAGTTTLWGTPGDPRHDSSRGWACVYYVGGLGPCERPPGLAEDAMLRMPVSCGTSLRFDAEAEPWNVPVGSVIDGASFTGEPLLGCNKVPFNPTVEAAPTSKLAESPSGLSFDLSMPNSGLLFGDAIAEGQPKKVEVVLPEGMTVNPSAAEGLAVCTPADYARERFDSRPGEGCPDASKIGNVEIDTPLIEEQVKGALYLASPHDNPTNSLLGLYIVARVPERGVLVKLAGKVSPDPNTGQLITTFDDAPQLPFESFDLQFREGGRAPLVTPPACGSYDVVAKFVPWSAQDPNNPAPDEVVTRTSTFTVQRGVDGGACPSGGIPPFDPEFQAGSINNDAGSKSPFDLRLTRKDGEQDMTKFSTVLPPGVLGSLAGVAKCPDSAIAIAKAKSASEELASPSCPANSQIGRSLAGAGVGSVLTYVGGKVYLGGAFHGDPLSVIAITPAKAGPFDVGTVVVHEALTLNPRTAEVEVDGAASDPIPHILQGIPLKLRDLRVYVDRPNFIQNPTSCEEEHARATLFGSFLNILDPSDDKPVNLSARYQAANCVNLGFEPALSLKLKGGTRRGGHPGLSATYKPRKGDANVKGLVVRLPRSAFLDQGHIRTICTRVQFAAKNCPKAARYGFIKAWTPLLEEPLAGPVYLRSSNHKLPDLVFDLHGLVDVEVATRIDSVGGGIRATLEEAPDAPLSKVLLKMQGAKKGLIVNSRGLCGSTNRANVDFEGHNGKASEAKPVLKPDCGGGKRKRGRHRG
jgi:hypothetical protein